MAGSSSSRKSMQSYCIKSSNLTITVGDDLYVRPSSGSKPWIAKVDKILRDKFGRNVTVVVKWYYRPEETKEGQKDFHGTSELLSSTHCQNLRPQSIDGKCKVHTLEEYQKLETIDPDDYYWRSIYDPFSGRLCTKPLPLHCSCQKPENPDLKMVQCEECMEWFHIKCIGMTDAEIEATANFFCYSCRRSEIRSRYPAAMESHQERTPANDNGLWLLGDMADLVLAKISNTK